MDGTVKCLGDIGNGEEISSRRDAMISCENCVWRVRWNDTISDVQWCDNSRS